LVPFVDLKFWLLTFTLITAYSSVSVLLSASAPVRTWLYGSDRAPDMLSERGTIAKNLFMISASVLILFLTHFDNLIVLIPLTALVYWTGKKLVILPKERALRLCFPVIIFLVVFLCYYKYSGMQLLINRMISDIVNMQPREKVLILVGVSYFSFKFIHFLIECYKKRINNLDFLTFLNYILFFPSFFAGPVNRYNQFSEDIHSPSVSIDHAGGFRRIIEGLFKKVVLCHFLLPYSLTSVNLANPSLTRSQALLGIYAYMLFIYFDFSGYTDMAIGSGKLVGINLPENFNNPFFKQNLQQFWANWHMSLTSWLTDYIYWPIAGKTREIQKLRTRPVLSANIGIILTFAVCGMWHGNTISFLIWGLYHGAGLSVLNFYTIFRRKHFSRQWKQSVTPSWYARAASTLLTFQFVAFGFLFFACNLNDIGRLWHLFLP
jgi:alginate O-acetyltransferase complex protein AlgI